MTPRRREEHPEFDAGFVHRDVDTSDLPEIEVQPDGDELVPSGVQGLIYLEESSAAQGGVCCVPELYRDLETWVQTQPDDRNPRSPDLEGYEVEFIPGNQSDLVIWDRLLAHANGSNDVDIPRYALYVIKSPVPFADTDAREERIAGWRQRAAPWG